MSDLFFYTIVGGVLVGTVLGTVFDGVAMPAVVLWLFGLAAAMGWLGSARDPAQQRDILRWLLLCSLLLAAIASMLFRVSLASPVIAPVLEVKVGETFELIGTVAREPDARERSTLLYIDTSDARVLVITDRHQAARYGDVVTVVGTLEHPQAFTTDLGRTFDYPGYLRAKGVGYTMSFAAVTVLNEGQGNWIVHGLLAMKLSFMQQIESIIPEPQVGLAVGLLLGVKQALGETYETIFRQAGIMHIVVLSGYNVMLVVTFFMYVLAYVLPFRARLIVGIIGITGFALMVGLSATVVRASVMAALLLFLRFNGNTQHILRALFIAGMIMLFFNPYLLLFDIGFQLSFMATWALIVAAPFLHSLLTFVPSIAGMREFLTATLVTQFFVAPLILFQIGEISLVAVIVNVLVLPMVPVAMLLTFLTGIVAFIVPPLATLVGFLAFLALEYILLVATFFAQSPLSVMTVPAFSLWWLFVLYVLIILSWYGLQKFFSHRIAISPTPKSVSLAATEVVGWQIEEAVPVSKKGSGQRPNPQNNDTPIFFR